jgi:hypothetical protein
MKTKPDNKAQEIYSLLYESRHVNESYPTDISKAIKGRMERIKELVEIRSKMSPEAKSEKEWKEKDKEFKAELAVLNSMLTSYKKYLE